MKEKIEMMGNEDFEAVSVPHSWLLVADNLHHQALKTRSQSGLTQLHHFVDGVVQWGVDYSDRASFLLAGFALENTLKGFLVYENPLWIKDGCLNKELKTHSLTRLRDKLRNTKSFKSNDTLLMLKSFESGLSSWARYPCGLNKRDTALVKSMTKDLWTMYVETMRKAGEEYKVILKTVWKGPHKFHGGYSIEGDWLGSDMN